MTQKQGAKPFDIDRWKLYYAYQRVNQNRGGSGVDNVTLEKYNLCNGDGAKGVTYSSEIVLYNLNFIKDDTKARSKTIRY